MKQSIAGIIAILLLILAPMQRASAQAISCSADGYTIDLNQLELDGEETLLDVFLMLPETTQHDWRSADVPWWEAYVVRIGYLTVNTNTEMFLKNTRAKEVESIRIGNRPGVLNGYDGLQKIVDVVFRKDSTGTAGKAVIEGDTKASGEVFGRVTHQTEKLWLMGQASGRLQYCDHTHNGTQNASIYADWNITESDNLTVHATQEFCRQRADGENAEYARSVAAGGCYNHDFSDNAFAFFQLEADYSTSDMWGDNAYCSRTSNPYAVLEFGFPLFTDNLTATVGLESDYALEDEPLYGTASRSLSGDGYVQLDWTVGKWGISVGDRFRACKYWLQSSDDGSKWTRRKDYNFANASVWCNVNDRNTVQASFARSYYPAEFMDFYYLEDKRAAVFNRPAYSGELRYTWQKPNLSLTATVRDDYQKTDELTKDNILTAGISGFWHTGVFRLMASIDLNCENYKFGTTERYKWVNLRLAPMVSLKHDWRIAARCVWNSRQRGNDESYLGLFAQPRLYLDASVSKKFGSHWMAEAKWHDIGGGSVKRHGVSAAITYSF